MPPPFTASEDSPEPATRLAFRYVREADDAQAMRVLLMGELSLETADHARGAIVRAQTHAREVTCDLAAVTYIDVPGMCVLLDLAARARHRDHRLSVANPLPIVRDVFRIFGLEPEVEIDPSQPSCGASGRGRAHVTGGQRRA